METFRVVSLIASSTEIVCALGLEERLVGRSHECDYPPSVTALPVCTRPRFEVSGSSREIDDRVKSLARDSAAKDALSVYEVFPDKLKELKPTHIITQTQCEVCAVSLRDVERAVAELTESQPDIISLRPNKMADCWEDFMRVASGLGVTEAGIRLVAELQRRIQKIEHRASAVDSQPSVACIEWADPLMAAGNWMPELVASAGGRNQFSEAGSHSPAMSFEELAAADPEVVFVSPCGFSLERTRRDLPVLQRQEGWRDLTAVRQGRVYLADGNRYFNRPGPRLVESLEILAEVLHPDVFHFGHEGEGWERAPALS